MFSLRPQVPKFTGPYTVGSTEYEIPISELDTQTSPPDPKINTLKFRLFYPTSTPYKGQTIPWVPAPQRQWTEAFGRFLGASLGWSSIVNPLLSLMTYITIPAIPNAPLRSRRRPYPLLVFSHGLAGNCNTYSTLCGSLASCGVIVAAVEHRDGSCPVSMIRDAKGQVCSQVDYRKYSHNPTAEVFNARNTQLRTRLWELDLLYTALRKLDAGEQLNNYALVGSKATAPTLKSSMDFAPGRVTWAGHSFGACTMTQFIKSIYYHHALPSLKGTTREHDADYRPLFAPRPDSDLIKQITPSSAVALLDVWTMPFRAPASQWLWEKPMPCHEITNPAAPTTISVMSTEFYNWTELLNRTRALLSANPTKAAEEIAQQSEPRSPKTPKLEDATPKTPTFATPPNKHFNDDDDEVADHDNDLLPPASLPLDSEANPTEPIDRSLSSSPASVVSISPDASSANTTPADSPASSTTSLSPSITAKPAPTSTSSSQPSNHVVASATLYHIPHSAHLSQSDFGPLFPTLTRVLMKAVDANGTMSLNVRAVTQCMRNAGLEGVGRVDWESVPALKQEKRRGWFGSGWFASREALAEGSDGEEDEREGKEREREKMLYDTILQETGMERWRELDVPVVAR